MLKVSPVQISGPRINLTALIDIVFLLLIYFLLTSNFIEQDSMPVNLPRVETVGDATMHRTMVVIDQKGNYFVENRQISGQDLEVYLRAQVAVSSSKNVLVKADRQVVYERVVEAMDIAKKVGAKQLMLATELK
ncbi:MAG: biopolymer transporter ExbD [Proteobacteria bacterium]|nr:biopolymer transporter ExbD [Pseudomonadota bacterium]MBU1716026.1 biopolymer transporter ExbD [Pseudomonadota bacterium]